MRKYKTEVRSCYSRPGTLMVGQPGEYGSWLEVPTAAATRLRDDVTGMRVMSGNFVRSFFPGGRVDVRVGVGHVVLRGYLTGSSRPDLGTVRIQHDDFDVVLGRMVEMAAEAV